MKVNFITAPLYPKCSGGMTLHDHYMLGKMLMSVAGFSHKSCYLSSAWIKSKKFLWNGDVPAPLITVLNILFYQNDQVYFNLFSCIERFICVNSFHNWTRSFKWKWTIKHQEYFFQSRCYVWAAYELLWTLKLWWPCLYVKTTLF